MKETKKNKGKPNKSNAHGNVKDSLTNQSRYSFPDKRERRDGPGGEDGDVK